MNHPLMSDLEIWLTILGMGIITFLCRTAFFMLPERYQLPPRVQQALRYAPACALVAIVAPALLLNPAGELNLTLSNHRLLAAIIAVLVFQRTRKLWLMIVVGMAVFNALRIWGH